MSTPPPRRAPCARVLASVLAPSLLLGCGEPPRSRFVYDVSIPSGWVAWKDEPGPLAPGEVLEAYQVPPAAPGPAGSGLPAGSLVIFRSPHQPDTTAAQLLHATRHLLLNLPSLRIEAAREVPVSGKPAVLIEAVADGTGAALAPTGLGKPLAPPGAPAALVPTRRIWIRVPRGPGPGTLEVFFHAPESEFEKLRPAWEAVLASLRIG